MNLSTSASRVSRTGLAVGMLLSLLLVTGCATGPQVRSASAPDLDLASFRSFSFYPELSTDRAGVHTLISQQLVFSTRREMEVRGFSYVEDPAQADLLINFHLDVAEQLRVINSPNHWRGSSFWDHRRGFYDPWWGHSQWPAHSSVDVIQYTQGTLSVDVIQANRNMLVWEGVATQQITQRTLNDMGPALDNAVHKLFERFPVAPKL